jgi:hypothetical protein
MITLRTEVSADPNLQHYDEQHHVINSDMRLGFYVQLMLGQ